MSRFLLILLVLILIVAGAAFFLAGRNSEVPTQRIEQDVTNEALAR